MYSLILDTSNQYLGVMLLKKDEIIDSLYEEAFRKQSELLIPRIKAILDKNKVKPSQLSRIYVNNGPGSYTGIRMSLVVSKTFGFVYKSQTYLVSSLLAQIGLRPEKVVSLLDARASRVYVGVYENGVLIEEEKIMSLDEVKKYISDHPSFLVVSNIPLEGVKLTPSINPLFGIFQNIKNLSPSTDSLRVEPFYFKEAV